MSVIIAGSDSRTLPARDAFGYPIVYYPANLLTDGAGNVERHPNGDAMVLNHTGDAYCNDCAARFSGQAFTVALSINETLPAALACDGCGDYFDAGDDTDTFYTAPPTPDVAAILADVRSELFFGYPGRMDDGGFTTGPDYNIWGDRLPRRDDDGRVCVHIVVLTWDESPSMVADANGAAGFLCAECAHNYLTGPNHEWAGCIVHRYPDTDAATWHCDGCGDLIGG